MGTVVTMQVVGHDASDRQRREREEAVTRAFGWFDRISDHCSRFDAESELSKLSARAGESVAVSTLLFEAVRFALAVAEESGGAFDPTVGNEMAARGFDTNFRTGAIVDVHDHSGATYRDVVLDPAQRTITLTRPMTLDLGAVAKGLAVDTAARELQEYTNFAIDAGGDLYLGGSNPDGNAWSVGIRHPREEHDLLESLIISNAAVCTSGDYERRGRTVPLEHHILDPRDGRAARRSASATVVAPSAMVADALATAAFVLGPVQGIELVERNGAQGMVVTPSLEIARTAGLDAMRAGARAR